jgi:Tripartite tricarboxylate transporter TctB family
MASQASDRWHGPLWVVLGAAIFVGSARIDRLQSQGVEWFAAPGLLLGVLIALTGALITLRAKATASSSNDGDEVVLQKAAPGENRRVLITLVLCLGLAAGLVGRGLPFGLVAAMYLFAHIALLQWHERGAANQRLRGLAVAAAVAIGAGLAVPFVFEKLFLVRLP